MPNIVGYGNTQVPTNAMLGDLAYQDSVDVEVISKIKGKINETASGGKNSIFVYDTSKDSDGGAWRKKAQNILHGIMNLQVQQEELEKNFHP